AGRCGSRAVRRRRARSGSDAMAAKRPPRKPAPEAMTVSEAGRKGGIRVRDERGVSFYREIGRKGGEAGGRKGGEAVRDKYGPGFYEEIGKKGGQKVRELIEQGKKRLL